MEIIGQITNHGWRRHPYSRFSTEWPEDVFRRQQLRLAVPRFVIRDLSSEAHRKGAKEDS
jgi:hypothetical protein